MPEIQKIQIPIIELRWTKWVQWQVLTLDGPNPQAAEIGKDPGVYEARIDKQGQRLTIGKASNLRSRVKNGLVNGTIPHSAGNKIRLYEDVQKINIRWAYTDRPAAAEEELHRLHKKSNHGNLPKYTKRT